MFFIPLILYSFAGAAFIYAMHTLFRAVDISSNQYTWLMSFAIGCEFVCNVLRIIFNFVGRTTNA